MDRLDELARALARRVEAMGEDVTPLRVQFEAGAWVSVRLLGRATGGKDGLGTAVRASGGVGIEITLEPCRHEASPWIAAWRLGPGWTVGQFEGRLRYALHRGSEQRRLRSRRDELWAHLEHERVMAIGKRDDIEMEMAAEAAAHGYCDILEEMSESDIAYWLWWLRVGRGIKLVAEDS